ncbi:sarcosine oxidase subunit gamma [Chelatococcus sambhunathii]|uniref:sarcosine oxidase subunit gamma n=1 Tax=Chelatococcus sambhunathii TaxID=363953 RepID=UPI002852B58C|nr:sarcosine oxidase subunit gamma family protein [Chelatococcus sambhunathii]
MPEALIAKSPLRPHVATEVSAHGKAGVVLRERLDLRLAQISAFRGREAELAATVREAFGVELPTTPKRSVSGPVAFAWAGPGRWLASSSAETDFSTLPVAVSDQSDGRAVLSISGPKARETLATLISLDLHPRTFATGDVALTHAASIAVTLWQADDAPTYELVCFRTFAATLWRWIVHAGMSREIDAKLG